MRTDAVRDTRGNTSTARAGGEHGLRHGPPYGTSKDTGIRTLGRHGGSRRTSKSDHRPGERKSPRSMCTRPQCSYIRSSHKRRIKILYRVNMMKYIL